jgi:hypothetical protein
MAGRQWQNEVIGVKGLHGWNIAMKWPEAIVAPSQELRKTASCEASEVHLFGYF